MKTLVLEARPDLADGWLQLADTVVTHYFEKARLDYLRDLAVSLPKRDSVWVQTSLHLDYRGSYLSDVAATVEISVTAVGNTSFTLSCRIYQHAELRVTGNCVLVNIDRQSQRPVSLCGAQRKCLSEEVLSFYRMPEAAAAGQY